MIQTDQRGDVLVVTIDRPDVRNAVDLETVAALGEAFAGAAATSRAVVLTGAGGHFCAGADLTGVEDRGFARAVRTMLDTLRDTPVPTIAAIDGNALGAGMQLAVACDLRVGAPGARFGIPAARLGVMIDHWTVQRVSAFAGASAARAMLLGAQVLDVDDAWRVGLVNRLGDLDDAMAWANEISTLAPLSLAGHKLALNALERGLPDSPDVEAAIERAWTSADVQEGIAAFRERRPPQFRGQ